MATLDFSFSVDELSMIKDSDKDCKDKGSELYALILKRRGKRSSVTKTVNHVQSNLASLTNDECLNQLDRLKRLREQLDELNDQITTLAITKDAYSSSEFEVQLEVSEVYFDKIDSAILMLKSHCNSSPTLPNPPQPQITKAKLPKVELPNFSGCPEEFGRFISSFEAIIDKHDISTYEKYVYLKGQLSGSAKALVESIPLDSLTYETAKQLLTDAYCDVTAQQYSVLDKLIKLKLTNDGDSFLWISSVRTILDQVKNLKIDLALILQYFIWNSLNDRFKQVFVQVTNKSKPTLDEIYDKMFEANTRYIADKECSGVKFKERKFSEKQNSVALATHVSSKNSLNFKQCKLCKSDNISYPDHSLSNCKKYPLCSDKKSKILELKGCVRCSSLSHQKSDCKTRFDRRCRNCNKWHMELLCDIAAPKPKSTETKKQVNETSQNGSSVVFSLMNYVNPGKDVALPTLTFDVKGKGNCQDKVPAILDSGSQVSFISANLCDKYDFPVLKQISIYINGCNTSTKYDTKIVYARINVGNKTYQFEAVVLPNIRTNVKIKNLKKAAKLFESKGYVLANKCILSHENFDISIILGADNTHLVETKVINFGKDDCPSSYLDSPQGVLLVGSVSKMLNNMNYLKNASDCGSAGSSKCCLDISGVCASEVTSSACESEIFCVTADVNSSLLGMSEDANENEWLSASDELLDKNCNLFLNVDEPMVDRAVSELNEELCDFLIDNAMREHDTGRLVIPLPWNPHNKHMLDDNFKLAKKILDHNVAKLKRDPAKLALYNEVIAKQEFEGIIERISHLDTFLEENPTGISFLAHNGVFKLDRQSTKCRIVFLANLNGNPILLSHNQCSFPGPNLNHKLSTSFMLLRFDKFLLTFDLKQAFLQIKLRYEDTLKLLFLWYSDVTKDASNLVAYRFLRLPFGLRFSPFVLMIALYIILVNSSHSDKRQEELKLGLYDLAYMDNLAWTSDSVESLEFAYRQANIIFKEYGFRLQQFQTNSVCVQTMIDNELNEASERDCKLFGLIWNKSTDTVHVKEFDLDINANTKRLILGTLNSVFDIFGISLPIFNRARLFLHKLQLDKSLNWDSSLSSSLQREWTNIVKQVRNSPVFEISRSCGSRSTSYELICFSDASSNFYGCVLYLKNLSTQSLTFLQARNRLINEQLKSKSMPVLELVALEFGVKLLLDTYNEFQNSIRPIEVCSLKIFSDSTIGLSWVEAAMSRFDKMRGKGVFIMNKLDSIKKYCQIHPVEFCHVPGCENPADYTTREVSGKVLSRSCFHDGPSISENGISILVPSPFEKEAPLSTLLITTISEKLEPVFPLNKYSSFDKAVSVLKCCFRYVNILKSKLKCNNPTKYAHLEVLDDTSCSFYRKSCFYIICEAQRESFPDIFEYFLGKSPNIKDIPEFVSKLNLTLDEHGLIRVKGKLRNLNANAKEKYPLLLHKNSPVTKAIIWDIHCRKAHTGVYGILNYLRKEFFIPRYYSAVKEVLKSCLWCKRLNGRTIKTNTNSYRDFRINPDSVPFRDVMIDHMGPFILKINNVNEKVWVLIITCLFSRAVSLELCRNLDVSSFLRAFQLHVFKHGLPKLIISDPGSTLIAGVNVIKSFLDDFETKTYLERNGINSIDFQTYPSGASWLGGLVENLVKQCKKLLYSSIHKRILDLPDFEFVLAEVVSLINKRPIAFCESLRDSSPDSCALTPEIILKGFSTPTLNVIPEIQPTPEMYGDKDWESDGVGHRKVLLSKYAKLKKVRESLKDAYHKEFLANLMNQAVDRKDRYKPVSHSTLGVGDLVSIKQPFSKPVQYPMGIIKSVKVNDLGEIVSAQVMKSNRQLVNKHVNDLIMLLKNSNKEVHEATFPLGHESPFSEEASFSRTLPRKAKTEALRKLAEYNYF